MEYNGNFLSQFMYVREPSNKLFIIILFIVYEEVIFIIIFHYYQSLDFLNSTDMLNLHKNSNRIEFGIDVMIFNTDQKNN